MKLAGSGCLKKWAVAAVSLGALAGVAQQPPGGKAAGSSKAAAVPPKKPVAAQAPSANPAPAAATGGSVAPAAPAVSQKPGSNKISMTVSDAPIAGVFQSLAALRPNTNIILAPEVTGKVSFSLRDVSWDTALRLIAESQGYEVTQQGPNIYRVHKMVAAKRVDVQIDMLTAKDVDGLSDARIAELAPPPAPGTPRTPQQARKWLLAHLNEYIRRISVQEQPATKVVQAIARAAMLNYSFTPIVRKPAGAAPGKPGQPPAPPQPKVAGGIRETKISLNLEFVRVEDALKLVAEQGGLACDNKNGVWIITPKPPETRKQEPLVLETFELKYLNLDDDLLTVCKGLLSKRGSVAPGKNKILVVHDTKENIENIRKTLAVMDKPEPQVLIEARFFELSQNDEKYLGIDWKNLGTDGFSINTVPFNINKRDEVSRTKTTNGGISSRVVDSVNHIVTDVATGAVSGTIDNTTTSSTSSPGTSEASRTHTIDTAKSAILNSSQFAVVLHALFANGIARQLSNPKIVVKSDQQATIHIGDQTPIFKSTTETTNGVATQTFELDPDFGGETVQEISLLPGKKGKGGRMNRTYTTPKGYLDLGTKLTVLPSVKGNDEVYLRIVPELVSVTGLAEVGSGANAISYPKLYSTRVETDFTIRSGQTVAIGGLVNERTQRSENHVPILGNLPLVGRLFSYTSTQKVQSETIIFLTVKIIQDKDLNTIAGIPIRAYMVQPEVERIRREDSAGAEYSPDRAKKQLHDMLAQAKKEKWTPAKLGRKIRALFSKSARAEGTAGALPKPAGTVVPEPVSTPAAK